MNVTKPLLLIGFRGTGKTTIAALLGDALRRPVLDTDHLITVCKGRTIAELFRDEGEAYFRDRETECLREALNAEPHIISTGGGVVLREENRQLLKGCYVVWLRAAAETLWQRLQIDPDTARRPPLTHLPAREEIEHLLASREPLYAACAHFTVDTDRLSPQDSVDLIVRHLSQDPAWT